MSAAVSPADDANAEDGFRRAHTHVHASAAPGCPRGRRESQARGRRAPQAPRTKLPRDQLDHPCQTPRAGLGEWAAEAHDGTRASRTPTRDFAVAMGVVVNAEGWEKEERARPS